MKTTHQEESNRSSSELNNHYQFLEQIAITDKKKQKRFFSKHQLNFQAFPLLKKKAKRHDWLASLFMGTAALFFLLLVLLGVQQNIGEHMQNDIFDIAAPYSHSPSIEFVRHNSEVSNQNKNKNQNLAAEEKIQDRILHIINHPKLDSHEHLYIDNTEIRTLMKQFYLLSEDDHFSNYDTFNYLTYLLKNQFVDDDIKKELAQHAVTALKQSYKTASLAHNYYVEHLSTVQKHIYSHSYYDDFDNAFYARHTNLFDFINQYYIGKKYTVDNATTYDDDFWKTVKS
jgi:hypothetical protein